MQNFRDLFATADATGIPMTRYLFNSIVISALSVILTIIICVSTGYMLSKKDFKAKRMLMSINTLSLMFVPIAVNIPRFLVIDRLGLINNFWVHIIPALAMPVGLFLVKQFIDQIPDALIEAAQIDGAGDFTIVRKIIAPMVKPALITVSILAFQAAWNNVDTSAMYINSDSMKSFAFYMNTLASNTGNTVAGQGMAAASALIMFVPNIIIFIFMQAQVMNTMAHSGIK
jgi:ABC-type glycerol-3-phosphate transport system permease component